MSATLERLRMGRRITWRTILGILLVPLTVAGALIWGLWSPTDRLEQVTAAVVNLDEPVTIDGQTVPMGRVLAGELIGDGSGTSGEGTGTDQNYTWLLTDAEDAAAGLDEGRYTAVVTIPETFSKDATSASEGADAATVATIGVETSERGRLLDGALAGIVTNTALRVLNETLGSQSVAQVLGGLNDLGSGVRDAADGASKLADGGSKLADGAEELAGGASDLADGAGQLATGAGQLADGVGKLATGADQLSAGSKQLASGAAASAKGGKDLAAGVKTYTDGATAAISGLQQGTGAAIQPLTQYRDAIAGDLIPMPDPATKQQAIEGLNVLIGQLTGAASSDPANPLNTLKLAGPELAQGAAALAAGQQELATGAREAATGTATFAEGVRRLAAGAPGLASGASELAAGTSKLAGGTSEIAEGTRGTADGAQGLADGLTEAGDAVPETTEAQRTKLSETIVAPVTAEGAADELFTAAGVPLFAGIALWAGALAAFLVLAPLWRRTREAARGVGFVTLRSALPAVAVGAAQGALVGLILPPLLGYDVAQWLGFFGLALIAGVVFALVNQGLSALLGGVGRFLSFALLVVGFTIGILSTVPPALQAIGDASPLGALFTGFQSIAMGAPGASGAFAVLILWGLVGLALTGFAAARARRTLGSV